MWLGISFEHWVLLMQLIALQSLILTWMVYRVAHRKDKPLFRIERVASQRRTVYYCMRRRPFNQWRSFEIEEGVKGYNTFEQAEVAMKEYLNNLGLDMSETTVEKEYG